MKAKTIKDAIVKVFENEKKPLAAREVYDKIVTAGLYSFKAKNPVAIVSAELRKSCKGVMLKKSHVAKVFIVRENNRYEYKP